MSNALRVAFIGFGAIGRTLTSLVRQYPDRVQIVGVAKATAPTPHDLTLLPSGARFVSSVSELAGFDVDLVVECAGHAALREFAPQVLGRGRDLLIASVGALADRALESMLISQAQRCGARILIPSGALGGLDVLSAARIAGLEAVTYVGRKPPRAWRGTRAEQLVNLDDESGTAMLLFDGTARQAALDFPQNANVTAAVSFAGLGFDATRVQLIADPRCNGNEHRLNARGIFGSFEIVVAANALADNPKTSMLAPCSLARCLIDLRATVVLA